MRSRVRAVHPPLPAIPPVPAPRRATVLLRQARRVPTAAHPARVLLRAPRPHLPPRPPAAVPRPRRATTRHRHRAVRVRPPVIPAVLPAAAAPVQCPVDWRMLTMLPIPRRSMCRAAMRWRHRRPRGMAGCHTMRRGMTGDRRITAATPTAFADDRCGRLAWISIPRIVSGCFFAI